MDLNMDSTAGSAMERVAPISRQIWDAKYRLKAADGTPVDLTIEDSWRRVARALAAVETDPAPWEQPFYEALQDFRFLPAGRILSGAGTARRVTLFNGQVQGDEVRPGCRPAADCGSEHAGDRDAQEGRCHVGPIVHVLRERA
jgi:ribonucleoside-diphosphate reductase alpha chain